MYYLHLTVIIILVIKIEILNDFENVYRAYEIHV